MSGRLRSAALAALAALAASCQAEPPTGIVVEVTSDLAGPDLEFHLRVLDREGRPQRDIPFRTRDLPGRLNLVPQDAARSGPVTVEASVKLGSSELSRRATVGFRPGALVLLRLPLDAACVCVTCPPGKTCEEDGLCADILKDAATLPPYSARTQPGTDAGTITPRVCTGDGGVPVSDASGDLSSSAPDATRGDGGAAPDAAPVPDGGPRDTTAPDLLPGTDAPLPMVDSGVDVAAAADLAAPTPDAPVVPADTAADLPAVVPDSAPPPDTGGRPQGAACTTNDQCQSSTCVDGFCCSSACAAPCMACSNLETGMANGQCAAALAGTDPDGDCAADSPSTCLYDGMCNGSGACRLYGTTTLCAAATCGGATFTPERMCTGAGGCMPPAPQNCGEFLCTMTGCPTTCQSHAACVSTAYCDGTCIAKKPALAACSAGYECLSGSCTLTLVCL